MLYFLLNINKMPKLAYLCHFQVHTLTNVELKAFLKEKGIKKMSNSNKTQLCSAVYDFISKQGNVTMTAYLIIRVNHI